MKSNTNKNVIQDRLPVTGHNVEEQLLGSPILDQATGENEAKAVAKLLEEWGLSDNAEVMCADTTGSNTGEFLGNYMMLLVTFRSFLMQVILQFLGKKEGSCVRLRKILRRLLLYAACRHHMYEVVLKGVFQEVVAVSLGPEIQIFKRFRSIWDQVDKTLYDTGVDDELSHPYLKEKAEEVLTFAMKMLEVSKTMLLYSLQLTFYV